jgi:hypothetical protein
VIHGLGDPDSMMGDLRMCAAGVTSHDDGVVDRRPSVRGLWHGGRMSSLVHQGGLGEA